MPKRILILSDPFGAPAFLPRIRYICDYLANKGWEIELYTEPWDKITFEHSYPIIELPIYRWNRGTTAHRFEWAYKAVLSLLFDWKNRFFSKSLEAATRGKSFDCVFCTTFSTSPLRAANDYATRHHIPLYLDIRDIEEQTSKAQYRVHNQRWLQPVNHLYTVINIRRRNYVLKKATTICTVSPWHVDYLRQFNNDVRLVYNGYNPKLHYPKDIRTTKFIISYSGKLYEKPLHDPEPLFTALESLKETEISNHLELCIHTDERGQAIALNYCRRFHLEDMIRIGGYISNEETAELYRRSSIILVFSNNEKENGPHGMMTTKYFEVVGTEKPIMLVTSDNGMLAEAIRKANAGIAVNNASETEEFIRKKFSEWKANGFTRQPVNQEEKLFYSRETQVAQIEQLFFPKKRLLVVADPYGKPSFAPRLRYLCDYLIRNGWSIDVFTEHWDNIAFKHEYPIYDIRLHKGEHGDLLYSLDWIIKSLIGLVFNWKDCSFYKKIVKLTSDKSYDAVFCTTCSTFPLPTALKLAEQKHLPLFCDLRDIEEQVSGAQYQGHRSWWVRPFRGWYRNINLKRRNKTITKATALITVSPWHVDYLKQFNSNVHLVYNGYNPAIHYFEAIKTERFTISYIGRLYDEKMQDPTLLFKAMQIVKDEIPELELLVHTSAEGQQRIKYLASSYGIAEITTLKGYVGIEEVPNLYRKSSVCVVLSNKTTEDGPKGIMTTKYFEIAGTKKPILLVRSDESLLADEIKKSNSGCAAETTEDVIGFIRKAYAQWREIGYTYQPSNSDVVEQYNREFGSAIIERILLNDK